MIKDYAALAGVLAGAIGGVLYVLLTLLCSDVYRPLGVAPAEVGLTYGDLLVRAAVSSIVVLAFVGVGAMWGTFAAEGVIGAKSRSFAWKALGGLSAAALLLAAALGQNKPTVAATTWWPVAGPLALGFGIGWLCYLLASSDSDSTTETSSGDKEPIDASLERTEAGDPTSMTPSEASVSGEEQEPPAQGPDSAAGGKRERSDSTAQVGAALIFGALLVMVASGYILVSAAEVDGDRLQRGLRPRQIGYTTTPPWDARVVRVTWARGPGPEHPRLPKCLLHLGEANGLSAFYDATPGHQRALRLPSSAVLIEVLPHTESSRPVDGRSSC